MTETEGTGGRQCTYCHEQAEEFDIEVHIETPTEERETLICAGCVNVGEGIGQDFDNGFTVITRKEHDW